MYLQNGHWNIGVKAQLQDSIPRREILPREVMSSRENEVLTKT